MRTLIFATVASLGMAFASPAMAQQQSGHSGGQWHGGGQAHGTQWHGGGQWHGGPQFHGGRHWGGGIGGRWIGGARAPGGWSAYRRPVRGWAMPGYWLAPSFYITDWGDYGLSQPPYGYRWSRYYDDAVLVDQYGRVMDSVSGLDWDGYGDDGYTDHGDDDYDYSHDVGPGAAHPPPPPPPGGPDGYRYGGPPPRVIVHQGPGCNCGGTIVGGYYYPGATTTTVTVTSAPVVTTRTEYIEESAPVVVHRKVVRKWHSAPKRTWKHQTKASRKVRCLC
ncbi:MAG: RcnB family protein [Sphingomonas sp.]